MDDKSSIINEWLRIEYYNMAKRIGFIDKEVYPSHDLILKSVRLIDKETSVANPVDANTVVAVLALMWEHVDRDKYQLKDFVLKMLSRIGYSTSAIIVDNNYNSEIGQFSAVNSVFDKCTLTILQSETEVTIGAKSILLTEFQKRLWDAMDCQQFIGISAPTSAGKSYVIVAKTIEKMMAVPLDVVYIVPTLSLLNQVTEDYNSMLNQFGLDDYLITSSIAIGESKAKHTVYVWTQERAISALSTEAFIGMPNNTILVVDEVQNIERVSEEEDIRAKVLYDTLQELRHAPNVKQIIIAGPRITNIADLGEILFGQHTKEIKTFSSPVLNLTYSVKKERDQYFFKQYCGLCDEPYVEKISNSGIIAGYGASTVTPEYLQYLSAIAGSLGNDQNIIFAPTSAAARSFAVAISEYSPKPVHDIVEELIEYYQNTVNSNYSLCYTLRNGTVYHHGKLPAHVRRTVEKAIRLKLVSNVACTTTLMQGVNLPAQNIIIRNPHLYTRHHTGEAELTSYEMANLRGRAGRLLKDFIGRTIVLDESEFKDTDGYDQLSLFDDVNKDVLPGYEEKFVEHKDDILDAVSNDVFVDKSMGNYGYLVTYIRQTVLRYGKNAKDRMAETGVKLTSKQVAAIILKLKNLSIPKQICMHNRYWDPFVLDDVYNKFKGKVPSIPTEKGAKSRLSDMLKFLRDNASTTEMYERFVPAPYRNGKNRGLLCSLCLKWANEVFLVDLLRDDYFSGEKGADRIEKQIKLLQDVVSYNIPLLIKPIVEMRNEKSTLIGCLQTGACRYSTRKIIEIGVPRELAIKIGTMLPNDLNNKGIDPMNSYDFEIRVRDEIRKIIPSLPYWEQVQLDFLEQA